MSRQPLKTTGTGQSEAVGQLSGCPTDSLSLGGAGDSSRALTSWHPQQLSGKEPTDGSVEKGLGGGSGGAGLT